MTTLACPRPQVKSTRPARPFGEGIFAAPKAPAAPIRLSPAEKQFGMPPPTLDLPPAKLAPPSRLLTKSGTSPTRWVATATTMPPRARPGPLISKPRSRTDSLGASSNSKPIARKTLTGMPIWSAELAVRAGGQRRSGLPLTSHREAPRMITALNLRALHQIADYFPDTPEPVEVDFGGWPSGNRRGCSFAVRHLESIRSSRRH